MSFQVPSKTMFAHTPGMLEAFTAIERAINQLGSVAGIDAKDVAATPVNRGSLAVVQDNGFHDVTISDPANERGETYFLEYDTDPSFKTATTISLGPSRSWRGSLGLAQNSYWRMYKQIPGSNPSEPINFGGQTPVAVPAGGMPGPPRGAFVGSGSGSQSGQGYGLIGAK